MAIYVSTAHLDSSCHSESQKTELLALAPGPERGKGLNLHSLHLLCLGPTIREGRPVRSQARRSCSLLQCRAQVHALRLCSTCFVRAFLGMFQQSGLESSRPACLGAGAQVQPAESSGLRPCSREGGGSPPLTSSMKPPQRKEVQGICFRVSFILDA